MGTRILLWALMVSHVSVAQTFTETILKELSFEKKTTGNTLVVANTHGHIHITGYEGEKVLIEMTKTIQAKTDARLEKGKAGIQSGIIDRADTLILYVQDGCYSFATGTARADDRGPDRKPWGSHYSAKNDCHLAYDYRMDYVIRVPRDIHIIASTINEGDISVSNVEGVVKARNINGSIRLLNLEREAEASTINGDVDVEYDRNPGKVCHFYSLNGNINALFQPGLSANVSFESFNGSFYTNIARIKSLPAEVVKTSHGQGLRYRINGNRYQIGGGDALLDFETFNGNVYLKEKDN